MNLNVPYIIKPHSIEVNNGQKEIDIFEIQKLAHFSVNRFYILYTEKNIANRGNHAHLNQRQILVNLEGKAKVTLISQSGKIHQFQLKDNALYIPAAYWIELKMSSYTKIACLAEQSYEDLKTIKDKSVFLKKKI